MWYRTALAALLAVLVGAHGMASAAAPRGTEVRAYVNDSCIVADEPYLMPPAAEAPQQVAARSAALLGLVVGKVAEALITQAVHSSANRIRKGATRRNTRYAVVKETNLYRASLNPAPEIGLNGALGCMTVVAGRFRDDAAGCQQAYQPRTILRETTALPPVQWTSTRSDDSAANPLRRANICTDGEPVAVYESRIEFSADGTAYRLRSAGYRVQSLITSKDPKAQRSVFYTVDIAQPDGAGKADVLTTAIVDLGRLKAGARAADADDKSIPWLRVPALSTEARRRYDEQTRVHQEVAGQIDALQRAITRSRRVLTELDQRIATANKAIAAALRQERLRTEVQIQTHEAELAARRMEYAELPRQPREFMPVSIEVGVTEATSDKPVLLAFANVMQKNSGSIATVATAAAGEFISIGRSVDTAAAGAGEPAGMLDAARDRYYDARLEGADASTAKADYNRARQALGLEALP